MDGADVADATMGDDVRTDDATRDVLGADVTGDSADAGSKDARDASVDVDGDAGPPGAIFPACTYVASARYVPSAIVDTTDDQGAGPSPCSCTLMGHVTINRVLCGSFLPSAYLSYDCTFGNHQPTGRRSITILDWRACSFPQPLEGGIYGHSEHPVEVWDVLLAEQIAGHADSDGSALDGGPRNDSSGP
jgi:hypothetical protein